MLFIIVTFYDLNIDQMDVKIAFLYNFINQLIYIRQPKSIEIKEIQNFIYQIHKIFYSLKQSLRLQYRRLLTFLLEKLELQLINIDHSIFITLLAINRSIISIFVDNIKIMAPKKSDFIKKIKIKLVSVFHIIDIGSIIFYLSLKVDHNRQKKQSSLANSYILRKFFKNFSLTKLIQQIP